MTKREKVIKGLECCKTERCSECPYTRESECLGTLIVDALDLLRAQQPRVMTHDEMTELGKTGGAVFIEESPAGSDPQTLWALVTEGVEPPNENPFNYPGGVYFNCVGEMGEIWDGDLYGLNTPLGWRAWSAKPTEEQREAVKWDDEA